jgi:hypothetical protein
MGWGKEEAGTWTLVAGRVRNMNLRDKKSGVGALGSADPGLTTALILLVGC